LLFLTALAFLAGFLDFAAPPAFDFTAFLAFLTNLALPAFLPIFFPLCAIFLTDTFNLLLADFKTGFFFAKDFTGFLAITFLTVFLPLTRDFLTAETLFVAFFVALCAGFLIADIFLAIFLATLLSGFLATDISLTSFLATLLIGFFIAAKSFLIFFTTSVIAQSSTNCPPSTVNFTFDFALNSTEGWIPIFAEYNLATKEEGLNTSIEVLPANADGYQQRHTGFRFSTNNRADDLFAGLKKEISGLFPGANYTLNFTLEFASNIGEGCIGIGGAPGESVYVKSGASTVEPLTENVEPFNFINIDKGNQAVSGPAGASSGNIVASQSTNCDSLEAPFYTVTLTHGHQASPGAPLYEVSADEHGNMWLLVGTDSGYEGITVIYWQKISVVLSLVHNPYTTNCMNH